MIIFKSLNQKISTPLAIVIIIILTVILVGGIFVNQSGWKEEKIIKIDEITNWKTYRNEEYGFEIKYPNNWEIKIFQKDQIPPFSLILEFESPILVFPAPVAAPEGGSILASFDIYVFNLIDYLSYYRYEEKDITFEEWLQRRIKDRVLNNQEEIIIGKEKWFKFDEMAYGSLESIYYYKNGLVYQIGINPDFSITDIVYQILSTFRFLE